MKFSLVLHCSVSVLCSSCAQKRVESEWNFNIEDGVPVHKRNTTSSESERGDSKKDSDRADKSQKMRRNMGRVLYRRSLPILPSP